MSKDKPMKRKSNWIPQVKPEVWHKLAGIRSWVCILAYISLASRADRYTGKCYASRASVSKEAGCSKRQITWAFRKLEEAGLIKLIKRGYDWKANSFIVFGLAEPKGGRRA